MGDSQPIVRRDCLVELANEVRRFEFREDLEENDDWRVPSTYVPSASTLPAGASARRGPYNTIRPEAASVGASRFQVSSPATAYIASNAIKDHCCQWTQNDVIDPGKVLRARIRYGRARVRKRLAGSKEMDAIFFDERKDETVTVVEVETSVTVEGQTDTQTATVRQGTQRPKGTSYCEEHCPILMHNEDPDLDPNNRTIRLQVGNAPALAQKLYVVVVECNS